MLQRVAVIFVIVLLCSLASPGAVVGAESTQPDCTYPLTVTDETGTEVSIEEPPERVVAIMSSDAQTVLEIGAGDSLVGMPIGPSTAHLETTGQTDITESDGYTVDTEAVVALDPDVVLVGNAASEELVEQLRDLDLTVYMYPTAESIDDVETNVLRTGQLTNECQGAQETVQWMDEQLKLLESAVEGTDSPLVYYEMGGGYTAGSATFQHELMETAGLENLAAEATIEGWNLISDEVVVDRDPDWFMYGDSWPESPIPESMDETTAATAGNEIVVDSNNFSQPGPRVVYAVQEIVKTVHSDSYDDVATEFETLDEVRSSTESDGSPSASDDGSGAGSDSRSDSIPAFGVPAAIGALLSVLALGRRTS